QRYPPLMQHYHAVANLFDVRLKITEANVWRDNVVGAVESGYLVLSIAERRFVNAFSEVSRLFEFNGKEEGCRSIYAAHLLAPGIAAADGNVVEPALKTRI